MASSFIAGRTRGRRGGTRWRRTRAAACGGLALCALALPAAVLASPSSLTRGGSIALQPPVPLGTAQKDSAGTYGGWVEVTYRAACPYLPVGFPDSPSWHVDYRITDQFGRLAKAFSSGNPSWGAASFLAANDTASGMLSSFVVMDAGLTAEAFHAEVTLDCHGRTTALGTANVTFVRAEAVPNSVLEVVVHPLTSRAVKRGRTVAVAVTVTARGKDVTGISLAPGLSSSSAAVIVTRQPAGLNGLRLNAGASRTLTFEVKVVGRGTARLGATAVGSAAGAVVDAYGEAQLAGAG